MTAGLPRHLRRFAASRDGVEAVLQHVGLRTWDLVLVDAAGDFVRDEFPSQEAAEAACRALGVPLRRGWDDELARRVGSRDPWGHAGGERRAL